MICLAKCEINSPSNVSQNYTKSKFLVALFPYRHKNSFLLLNNLFLMFPVDLIQNYKLILLFH
jgi:hypothetical protein